MSSVPRRYGDAATRPGTRTVRRGRRERRAAPRPRAGRDRRHGRRAHRAVALRTGRVRRPRAAAVRLELPARRGTPRVGVGRGAGRGGGPLRPADDHRPPPAPRGAAGLRLRGARLAAPSRAADGAPAAARPDRANRAGPRGRRGRLAARPAGGAGAAARGGRRGVEEAALRLARRGQLTGYPWATPAVVEQLLDAKLLIARAVRARFFAVVVGGQVVTYTDLYDDGRTAQIEDVATLAEHRGHGYA